MLETESFFQVALHRDKSKKRSKWETVVSLLSDSSSHLCMRAVLSGKSIAYAYASTYDVVMGSACTDC